MAKAPKNKSISKKGQDQGKIAKEPCKSHMAGVHD